MFGPVVFRCTASATHRRAFDAKETTPIRCHKWQLTAIVYDDALKGMALDLCLEGGKTPIQHLLVVERGHNDANLHYVNFTVSGLMRLAILSIIKSSTRNSMPRSSPILAITDL